MSNYTKEVKQAVSRFLNSQEPCTDFEELYRDLNNIDQRYKKTEQQIVKETGRY